VTPSSPGSTGWANYPPWIVAEHPDRNELVQPWLRGFEPNPFRRTECA
jgi:hypothetical protein